MADGWPNDAMNNPQMPAPPSTPERLRLVGQRSQAVVLACLFALWGHELFSEATDPKGWKLSLMLLLMVLGAVSSACLLIAWGIGRWNRQQR